jgi:hypothetical protein
MLTTVTTSKNTALGLFLVFREHFVPFISQPRPLGTPILLSASVSAHNDWRPICVVACVCSLYLSMVDDAHWVAVPPFGRDLLVGLRALSTLG